MKKICCSMVFSLLVCVSLWGQAGPNPAPAPQPNQAALPAGVQNRPLPPADTMAFRMQLNRESAAELEQMRVKLSEMKTNDSKIKDPAVRKHMQLDADLWDLMYSHMNGVTAALMQMRSRPSSLSPAAQTYRRQTLQGRMGAAPGAIPGPAQSAPAQTPPPPQAPAPSHP